MLSGNMLATSLPIRKLADFVGHQHFSSQDHGSSPQSNIITRLTTTVSETKNERLIQKTALEDQL